MTATLSQMSESPSGLVGYLPTNRVDEMGKSVIRRGCGVLRMGRNQNTGHTKFIRVPCGSRRCTQCQPKVIAAKMDATPDDALHMARMSFDHFANVVGPQLARQRKKGGTGDYRRIPVSFDEVIIVSDNPLIGVEITRTDMEDLMLASRSEWGPITCSKAWRVEQIPRNPSGAYVDEGIVTSSLQWIEVHAQRMKLRSTEAEFSLSYRTTAEQHEALCEIAGVKSDAVFWEDVRARAGGLGDDFIGQFVARVVNL